MSSINSNVIFQNEKEASDRIKQTISDQECGICLIKHGDTDIKGTFHPYGTEDGSHFFHQVCLEGWVDRCAKNNIVGFCPLCKQTIALDKGIFQINYKNIIKGLRPQMIPALKKAILVFLTIFATLNALPWAEQKTYQWLNSTDHYNSYCNFTNISILMGVTYLAQETGTFLSKTTQMIRQVYPNNPVRHTTLLLFKEFCRNAVNLAAFTGATLAFSLLPFCQTGISNQEQLLFFNNMLKLFAAATCLHAFIPWFF